MKTVFIFNENYYFSSVTRFKSKMSLLKEFCKCVGFPEDSYGFYVAWCVTNPEMVSRLGNDIAQIYFVQKSTWRHVVTERSYTFQEAVLEKYVSAIMLKSGELVPLVDGTQVQTLKDETATVFRTSSDNIESLTNSLKEVGMKNFLVISDAVEILCMEETSV